MKNLIRRILRESWKDTGWETDTEKITIQDVLDYLDNDEVYNLSVKTILDTIGDKFTTVKKDLDRILKADLNHPIIIVKKNGELSFR